MIFATIIGGMGTIEGPILGTIIFFVLQQTLASYGTWYFIILGLADRAGSCGPARGPPRRGRSPPLPGYRPAERKPATDRGDHASGVGVSGTELGEVRSHAGP
jgi:hypothetical protein